MSDLCLEFLPGSGFTLKHKDVSENPLTSHSQFTFCADTLRHARDSGRGRDQRRQARKVGGCLPTLRADVATRSRR